MTQQYVYAGDRNAGRVLRLNSGALTRVEPSGTAAVLFKAQTWPLYPGGPNGIAIFRSALVRFNSSGAYSIRITPIVNGVNLASQDFSGAAGEHSIIAFFASRGSNMAVRVEQLTRTGEFELIDIQAGYSVLRSQP